MTASPISERFKKIRPRLEKLPLNQQLILTGIVVGVASGISAYLFSHLVDFVTHLSAAGMTHLSGGWRVLGIVAIPGLGGIVTGILTHRYLPDAKGHGILEVKAAIMERDGHIDGRVAWVKTVASAATLGSGGSTGREGPIVQIGASVGSILGRWMGVSKEDLKSLVAAGAAGGLAAAFNIPLAAVFFVMEVVLKNFANEAFPAIVISTVIASATSRILLGESAFINPISYQWNQPSEFIYYALLGFACAPIGLFYRRSVGFFEHVFSEEKHLPEWLRPALGGFLLGALALFLPGVLGTGQDLINNVLSGQNIGWMLAALAIGKIIATSLTLGSGGSGGALMPSLFVGAMVGGTGSILLNKIPGVSIQPGAFALVGMGCVFTAAFQAPFTAIIMVFEITRDYGILTPVMLGCVISYISSRGVHKN